MVNEPGAGARPRHAGGSDSPPLFEVVGGRPTAEEVAALAVALAARLAPDAALTPPARRPGGWTDRSLLLRLPVAPGPGAWRRSALPR